MTYRWCGDGVRWSKANLFSTFPQSCFAPLWQSDYLCNLKRRRMRGTTYSIRVTCSESTDGCGRADFEAIRIVWFDNPVVSHARIFAKYEREASHERYIFAAHLASPRVGPCHFGESGFPKARPRGTSSVTRTALRSFARKEPEPANCKWPGDGERFSVIAMDRGMQLDGTAKSHGRISSESCSDRAPPAHSATCRLGGRSAGAIGGRRRAESFR